MADEKTPAELEAERVRLMRELENEDPETANEVRQIEPPTVRLSPDPPKRPSRKEPDFNSPRKFKDVTPGKNNTVLIVLVVALVMAVIGYMVYNYKKSQSDV